MFEIRTDLRELNNVSPAPFSDDFIICQSDYLTEKGIYLYPGSETVQGSVPLDKVIGHSQIYGEMKWGDCLKGRYLKRIDRGLRELQERPEYYLSDVEKAGLSFTKIENDYFIVSGKHRTVVARFLEYHNAEVFRNRTPLSNVTIHHKRVDYDYMKLKLEVEELKEMYLNLEFIMSYTSQNSENCLSVHPKNYGLRSEFYTRGELASCIRTFKKPSFKRKLESERTHRLISFRDCFKTLIY